MWDLTSEVQWWEEWQLRILVLGSLFLQFVLFIGSMARHARSLKLVMWFAYLGADALAIYALTTLFNRHKQPAGSGDATTMRLEVLWAPVLLHHLGGLHTFTAYSVEDNELWGRHLVTLVSQVTVAIYVFCRSWSGADKRMLQAAILLFIAGILKFIQKVWALKAASFNSLVTSSSVYPQRRAQGTSRVLNFLTSARYVFIKEAESQREKEEHDDLSLEEYIQQVRELVSVTHPNPYGRPNTIVRLPAYLLLVDLSSPFTSRFSALSFFLKLSRVDKYVALKTQCLVSFTTIYTSFYSICNVPGSFLLLLFPFMSLASTVLFCQSHKYGYKENDVTVTYILLCCTTAMEFLPFLLSPCAVGAIMWSFTAAQNDVISFSGRRSKPTKLMRASAILGLKDYINKHWYIQHESESMCIDIIYLVFKHLIQGWNQFIVDATSYKRFNNLRGQWTMSRHHVHDPRLLWSLQVPFDLSVLVWHVATELCLHHPKPSSSSATANNPAQDQSTSTRRYCKGISDYMIYLLVIRPEMLLPGTRPGLFTITSDDINIMLRCAKETPSRDERTVAQQILRAAQPPQSYANQIGPWILKACKLAEGLMELLDEEERWKVIQGVWVVMLCYSAGRCRGYLHAKSMGEGVEFLTYIWFLLWYMGMETLADKLQRPEEHGATSQREGIPPV